MTTIKRTRFGFSLFFSFTIFAGIQACGDSLTTEACLITGDPECNSGSSGTTDGGTTSDTGTGTGGDTGAGGHTDSGGAGGNGEGGTGGTSCTSNPNFGLTCVTLDGKDGHYHCLDNILTCLPDGSGSGGGDAGGGGGSGDAGTGTGTGGGGVYHCSTDPLHGTTCNVGPINSVCYNSGLFLCYNDTEAPKCNVAPHPPNPAGEICGNGIDDNCNGNTDESPCTPSGSGGSGGSDGGGTGGSDGGGTGGSGGGGTGGGASCTTATAITTTTLAPSSLTSLLKGAGSVDASDPLIKALTNNDFLALNANGGISVSVNMGKINVFRANTPGGDPTPLLDDLFCRQLGINPPTPASCNMGVIGSRSSAAYLSALNVDFQCWRNASCVSTIAGFVPGDLFALMKVVQNGDSLSQSPFADAYSAAPHFIVEEMPHLCP